MSIKFLQWPLVAVLTLSGCGSKTNLFALITPAAQKNSFDNLMSSAQSAYDRGDSVAARRAVQSALQIDPGSEAANELLAFVSLELAGADPYELAKTMLAAGKVKQSSTSATLTSLQQGLGLTSADIEQMGTRDETVPDLPLLLPSCMEDARAAVKKLSYINDAVVAACPFVDPTVPVGDDARQFCLPTSLVRSKPGQAHFLWAMAHLAEALAIHAVLTYSTSSDPSQPSNLEQRLARVQSPKPGGDVAALAAAASSIASTVKAVMPTSAFCSERAPTTQLAAMVHDLLAVAAAFKHLTSVPPAITRAIDQATTSVKGVQAQAAGASTGSLGSLKADLGKALASGIASRIDQIGSDAQHPLSDSDKTALCSAFQTIAAGSTQASKVCGAADSGAK